MISAGIGLVITAALILIVGKAAFYQCQIDIGLADHLPADGYVLLQVLPCLLSIVMGTNAGRWLAAVSPSADKANNL